VRELRGNERLQLEANRRFADVRLRSRNQMGKMTELDSMSVKELEKRFANTNPNSINHDLIKPVLDAKRRRADSRRTWIISLMSATIAALGIVVGYLIKK
jgi:hypothetical protein